ncbi:hypothetical protein SNEBB_011052 [Seison nebaliae]|nr:hypothetical protein SNEBB_011052 [Seison nebaliae]
MKSLPPLVRQPKFPKLRPIFHDQPSDEIDDMLYGELKTITSNTSRPSSSLSSSTVLGKDENASFFLTSDEHLSELHWKNVKKISKLSSEKLPIIAQSNKSNKKCLSKATISIKPDLSTLHQYYQRRKDLFNLSSDRMGKVMMNTPTNTNRGMFSPITEQLDLKERNKIVSIVNLSEKQLKSSEFCSNLFLPLKNPSQFHMEKLNHEFFGRYQNGQSVNISRSKLNYCRNFTKNRHRIPQHIESLMEKCSSYVSSSNLNNYLSLSSQSIRSCIQSYQRSKSAIVITLGDDETNNHRKLKKNWKRFHSAYPIPTSRMSERDMKENVDRIDVAVLDCLLENNGELLDLKGQFLGRIHHNHFNSIKLTLISLDLSYNMFETIPTTLESCKQLKVLNVRNNPIKRIPKFLFDNINLQHLNLSFCLLNSIDYDLIGNSDELTIDISFNNLSILPNISQIHQIVKLINKESKNESNRQC